MPGEYNSNYSRRPGSSSGPPGSYRGSNSGSYRYNGHRGRNRYGGYRRGYSAEGYDRYRGSSYYKDRREYSGNRERTRYLGSPLSSSTSGDYNTLRRGQSYQNTPNNDSNVLSNNGRKSSEANSSKSEAYDGHTRYSRGFAPHFGHSQEAQDRPKNLGKAIPRGPAQLNQEESSQGNMQNEEHKSPKDRDMKIEVAKSGKVEVSKNDPNVRSLHTESRKDVDKEQKPPVRNSTLNVEGENTSDNAKISRKSNVIPTGKSIDAIKEVPGNNANDKTTKPEERNESKSETRSETNKLASSEDLEKVMIKKIMKGSILKKRGAENTDKVHNTRRDATQAEVATENPEKKTEKFGKKSVDLAHEERNEKDEGNENPGVNEKGESNVRISIQKNSVLARDEDQPILNGRKKHSVIISDADESEADTEVEESLPMPSRRTRRIHRLISRRDQADDSSSSSERPEFLSSKMKKKKSQGTRKVSGRHGRDASGRTLLQRICARGNFDDAKKLIDSSADVNAADYAGNTPLHEAALEGYLEIATLLLDNNADIDKQSGQMDRDTPLIDAASNLHYDVVKLFIDRGADPTIANAQGDTALDSLEDEDDELDEDELKVSKKLKRLLIHYTKDWKKSHQQERVRSGSAPATEPEDSITQRRNNNTFFDFFTREGRSEIYTKVSENDVTYVLNYLSNLAGSRVPPDLLTLAARHGHTDIASLLLAFGAKVNYHDSNGRTPLMYAVGKDHMDMVKLLLENGAKIALKDKEGKTALEYAKESDLYDEDEIALLNGEVPEGNTEENDNDEESSISHKQNEKQQKLRKTKPSKSRSKKQRKVVPEKEPQNSLKKETNTEIKKEPGHPKEEAKMPEAKKAPSSKHEKSSSPANEPIAAPKMVKKSSNKIVSLSAPVDITVSEHRRKSIVENLSGNTVPEARHRSESRSRSGTPVVELTEKELNLKKQREEEAKIAREKLENERLERKRIRQQQIAKNIEEMEKKRAEEAKTEQLRKRKLEEKEQEESARKRRELEKIELAEKKELEIEKKKLIRSYYPYGVRIAHFGRVPTAEEVTRYLPLYVFNIDDINYVVDVQACLVLGVENIFADYPELDKISVSLDHKSLIWNFLWPMIGSFIKRSGGESDNVQNLITMYEAEYNNFKKMMVHWIRLDQFYNLVERTPALKEVKTLIQKIGTCNMKIALKDSQQKTASPPPPASSEHNTVDSFDSSFSSSKSGLPAPLQFKACKAFQMIGKNMW